MYVTEYSCTEQCTNISGTIFINKNFKIVSKKIPANIYLLPTFRMSFWDERRHRKGHTCLTMFLKVIFIFKAITSQDISKY